MRSIKDAFSLALINIDEVGFEPMTRQEASLFFRLVSYRYGQASILITTNKGIRIGANSSPATKEWLPPSSAGSSLPASLRPTAPVFADGWRWSGQA